MPRCYGFGCSGLDRDERDLETREENCCQFEVAAAAMTIARVG